MPGDEDFWDGANDLELQLKGIAKDIAQRAIKDAIKHAAKPVLAEIKARAPRGTEPHKTYRGRIVNPTYGARSLQMKLKHDRYRGEATVRFGTTREGWYLVQFYDKRKDRQIPYYVTTKRTRLKGVRAERPVKPYVLGRKRVKRFFTGVFKDNERAMLYDFRHMMRRRIAESVKRHGN